jgi:hypothetical protein
MGATKWLQSSSCTMYPHSIYIYVYTYVTLKIPGYVPRFEIVDPKTAHVGVATTTQ